MYIPSTLRIFVSFPYYVNEIKRINYMRIRNVCLNFFVLKCTTTSTKVVPTSYSFAAARNSPLKKKSGTLWWAAEEKRRRKKRQRGFFLSLSLSLHSHSRIWNTSLSAGVWRRYLTMKKGFAVPSERWNLPLFIDSVFCFFSLSYFLSIAQRVPACGYSRYNGTPVYVVKSGGRGGGKE